MRWKVALLPVLAFALSAASFQAGWARSIDELIDLAGKDALPEVRAGAGLALGKLLIDSPLTNSELESMAVVGRSPELRGAAGAALRERLLLAGLGLEELEALASGPSTELRGAAIPALVQATVAAVGRGELSLPKLARAIAAEGATPELRLARAEALFLLLRAELVAPGAQGLVEAVLRGERVEVKGVELNGEILEIRAAASELLAGIYKFYGLLDRLRDPLAELLAVVTDLSLTAEFRAAGGEALEFIFLAERGRALAALQELGALLDQLLKEAQGQPAQAGQVLTTLQELFERERANLIHTAEVGGEFTAAQRLENVARNLERMRAALALGDLSGLSEAISAVKRDSQVIEKGVTRAPDVPLEALMEWAAFGGTPELRRAAGAALGKRLLWAGLSYDELLELVASGPSTELRSGAGAALTAKLIEMGPSEAELLRMIAQYTWAFGPRAGTSKELGEALSRVLAQLWLG